MKKFLKVVLWVAMVCAVLAAVAIGAGVFLGDLNSHMTVVVHGDTITVDSLGNLPWPEQLLVWAALTLALLLVAAIVPASLLFALTVTVLALAFAAALLAIPVVLMAAPFALIVWLIWFRKRPAGAASKMPQ